MKNPLARQYQAAVGNPKPRPPKGPNTGLGGLQPGKPLPGGLPGAFGRPKPTATAAGFFLSALKGK